MTNSMSERNWVTIKDTDDWMIEYNPVRKCYRVSYFEDGHFVDEVIFREYRGE